ncbi:transcriptional regulator [Paractinoplanes deccanensis]|uniref:Transcriptional regulator n=1 Tax=Paractinoplanes deccanensis TaxID=113561 RepID=A0ABQ3Y1B9_9ACTN|nr:LuxR family transcriptional regulator [Actinoplanes deccanensis]GID73794.1 transcriptional regulator [Actinoplanes deccanensis]
MTMIAESGGPAVAELPGRAAERDRLSRAVRDAGNGRQVIVLHGEAGIGKTALLRACAADAAARGFRVVEAAALLSAAPGADPVDLRMTMLSSVADLCRRGPVMIVADGVGDGDADVVGLLMFVARRLSRERLLLVFAARGLVAFGRVSAEVTLVPVGPLSPNAAAGVLDGRPVPPRGAVRAEILHYAAGNPFALTELARAVAGDTLTALRPNYRVSVTGVLARTFAPGLDGLPPATRRVLLYAAASEHDGLGDVLAAAGASLADCAPAEQARLVGVVGGRLSFARPMVRAVCYFTAPFGDRQEAHARLAAVAAESAARDWHVAHVGGTAGDFMAVALERAAGAAVAQARGLEAAALLERAAENSTDPHEAARRYGRAAAEADRCGDIEWSRRLSARVFETTGDPRLLAGAVAVTGNIHMYRSAGETLALAERLLRSGLPDPGLTTSVLAIAARSVLTDGAAEAVATLRRLMAHLPAGSPNKALRALAECVADPAGWVARTGPLAGSTLLDPLDGAAERVRLLAIGGVAWIADEVDVAADLYRRAVDRVHADGSIGVLATATVALVEALFDLGRLDEAARLLADADDLVGANSASPVRRAVVSQRAVLAVRRGDPERARRLLGQAGDPALAESPFVAYLLHRAAGEFAAATEEHEAAVEHYRAVFAADGTPIHFLMSQRVVLQLAGSALQAGRRDEVLALLRAARRRADPPSARRRWAWDLAFALLDFDGDRARRLLAERDAGVRWPYEHAVAQALVAEALRARRQPVEARPLLVSALDTFLRQGATRDAEAVRAHLRASGVVRAQHAERSAFTLLTAQQQQIARLAVRGMSNRAIAEHFGLSPRTIGFHLYQIYPKLGVARRDQLRDVVPEVVR